MENACYRVGYIVKGCLDGCNKIAKCVVKKVG